MFSRITPHYDLLNRMLSGRRDVYWRKFTARRLTENSLMILDVATGTGDLALQMARDCPQARVIGLDFVQEMLCQATEKTSKRGLDTRLNFTAGDAMKLPFADDIFDAATIAFGFRNIPNRQGALSEMKRVVKPGGKVLVLEMTFPRNLKLRRFFTWYLNRVIPAVGGFISRDRDAYRYLPDSVQGFLHPNEMRELFENAGFSQIKEYPLTFGITYLHEGIKS